MPDRRLSRTLTLIAAAVGVVTVLAIVANHLVTAYAYRSEQFQAKVDLAAAEASRLVYANPLAWRFQEERLIELLSGRSAFSWETGRPGEETSLIRLLDQEGKPIIELGGMPPRPTMTRGREISDGFEVVGYLEVTESVLGIWRKAVVALLFGVAVALAIFLVLRVLPLRALEQRESELDLAHQAERDSREQLERIADAMPALIGYLDADQRYCFVNRIGQAWYRRPRDQIVGTAMKDLIPPELYAWQQEQVAAVLAGQQASFDAEATFADGVRRQIRSSYVPHLGPKGEVLGFFELIEDVTALRETEARLRQSQKTEALGQLTGGVAHDFNNMLGVILGNIELLQQRYKDDDMAGRLTSSAIDATLRGRDLTQRLLAFARKQVLAPRPTDLNALVGNATEMLKRTLEETIEIETVLAGDLWSAMADPSQIENALLNLAINARDAMAAGGRLTVETDNVRLDGTEAPASQDIQPGPYVMLAVTDTGCGMTPEVAARAFDPFFTTKPVGKGSGLGLSMVYGFARQSGGHVNIYSEQELGTTVKLYLPRATSEHPAVEDHEPDHGLQVVEDKTVLVVEDDPDLRAVAVSLLDSMGFSILEARSGPEALAVLEAGHRVDLLFTDVVLPDGMNGVDLAGRVQALHPGLEVLFTSGYAAQSVAHGSALEDGAPLLSKPYRKADLAHKIESVFKPSRFQAPERLKRKTL